MTDQPTQDAIVSQRDREVAADFWCSSDHSGKRRMLEGCADNSDLLKMLATYRAEIEAATIERCAGVVPADVVALVCAAWEAWETLQEENPNYNVTQALDAALDPFASRVCYGDEGGDLPEAHADPCTCAAILSQKEPQG